MNKITLNQMLELMELNKLGNCINLISLQEGEQIVYHVPISPNSEIIEIGICDWWTYHYSIDDLIALILHSIEVIQIFSNGIWYYCYF